MAMITCRIWPVLDCVSRGQSKRRRGMRLAALPLLLLVFSLSAKLNAAPVTYSFTIVGRHAQPGIPEIIGPVVQLDKTYGGSGKEIIVVLSFSGDTADVQPWSVSGATGYEIRRGTAAFVIYDSSSGGVLADGTFDPSAGIFISIDDVNGGIGFGSQAVWPTVTIPGQPTFPGQPAYPFANALGSASTYDLKSTFTTEGAPSQFSGALSCVNFPGRCGNVLSLPLSNGQFFTLLLSGPNVENIFSASVLPLVNFSSFSAQTTLGGGSFTVKGNFRLGDMSNGVNPVQEPVTLTVNSYVATIPAGLFAEGSSGGLFFFNGLVNGAPLFVEITKNGRMSYSIVAQGSAASVGATTPISVGLTIGDNTGTTISSQHE